MSTLKIPEIIACEIVDMFNFKELLTFPTPCEASDERHFKICKLLSKHATVHYAT